MRPVIVKAYGSLYPAGNAELEAVCAVLSSWFVEDAAELDGDLLKISFEGDFFPEDEVVEAVRPFLRPESGGRLDILDLEAWTLHRWFFAGGVLKERKATLDKALEQSTMASGQ